MFLPAGRIYRILSGVLIRVKFHFETGLSLIRSFSSVSVVVVVDPEDPRRGENEQRERERELGTGLLYRWKKVAKGESILALALE